MSNIALVPSTSPTLESLTKSGAISKGGANSIMAAYNRMVAEGTLDKSKAAAYALGEGIPVVGAAGLVGMAMGAAHALLPNGLDIPIPGTKRSVPIDGISALIGLLGGAGAAYDGKPGVGRVIQGSAATCMGIYTFRTVHDTVTQMKAERSGATAGGGASVAGLQKIGKVSFAGDPEFGAEPRQPVGSFAANRRSAGGSWFGADPGEDPIVKAARNL